MLSGRTFFWNPESLNHCGFQVKCVVKCMSRCVELSLRSVDGLGGGAKVSTREKSRVFHQDLLYPREWWQSEERPQQVVCYRVEDGIGDLEERRKRDDLQSVYLLPWLESIGCCCLFVCFSFFE